MISVTWAYLAFAVLALASFRVLKPAVAALSVFLAGWLVLPVGHYPAGSAAVAFPYWITGLAVPSSMLLTKAWIAPCVALAGALIFDFRTVRTLRFSPFDVPVALWCLWPFVQGTLQALAGREADPQPLLASLYIAGCWGAPWLLGRVYFDTRESQRLLMQGLAWSAVALLPIALVEGVFGPGLAYAALYEPHPFRFDGAERYVGFRPLGFFENGNQYGLWVGLCAIAAVWLARTASADERPRANVVAAIAVAMTLVAQSVGAIVLMALGLALLFAVRFVSLKRMTIAAAAVFALSGTVYFSGVIPVRELATNTSAGRAIVDTFKGAGRGSFTWRVSQDQKLMALALHRPLLGSARWDWWASQKVRPWGLPLLVTGQFGLVGAALAFAALLGSAVRVGLRKHDGDASHGHVAATALATLVMLTVFDALLNSFVFFPALIAAGGLAFAQRGAASGERSTAEGTASRLRAAFTPYRGPARAAAVPRAAAPSAAKAPAPSTAPPVPTPPPRPAPAARRPTAHTGDDRPVRSPGDPRNG